MSDAARLSAQRAAAECLRQLLLKPGAYRDAWRCHVAGARPRDEVINQLAVAEVLASHSKPGRGGDAPVMPYQLRDVVSGALSGSQLSPETLERFIEAFGFHDHDASQLRRLLAGSSRIGVLVGTRAVPVGVEPDVDAALGPRQHQTLSLHDHIWVGADGQIDRSRTMHVVEAIAPGVDRIPLACDDNVLTLEVGQGCKELGGQLRWIGGDLFATEILLSRTLDIGETLTLEYWLSYRWPPGDLAAREYRRVGMRQLYNLDIRVEFDPDWLPSGVWWTHWDGTDGKPLAQEAVSLDSQRSAHRYVRLLERTAAGFSWERDGDQGNEGAGSAR
jgi:hypothetical protein